MFFSFLPLQICCRSGWMLCIWNLCVRWQLQSVQDMIHHWCWFLRHSEKKNNNTQLQCDTILLLNNGSICPFCIKTQLTLICYTFCEITILMLPCGLSYTGSFNLRKSMYVYLTMFRICLIPSSSTYPHKKFFNVLTIPWSKDINL